jgi:hypothetical protein
VKFEYICAFREGDPVPEWMLVADPIMPGSISITFAQDCHVFETTDGYWVVNDRLTGRALINIMGGDGSAHAISASGRTVIIAATMTVLGSDGDDGEARHPDTQG